MICSEMFDFGHPEVVWFKSHPRYFLIWDLNLFKTSNVTSFEVPEIFSKISESHPRYFLIWDLNLFKTSNVTSFEVPEIFSKISESHPRYFLINLGELFKFFSSKFLNLIFLLHL